MDMDRLTQVMRKLALEGGASKVSIVRPCSMERRPDPEYDFNEPLLEKLLQLAEAKPENHHRQHHAERKQHQVEHRGEQFAVHHDRD